MFPYTNLNTNAQEYRSKPNLSSYTPNIQVLHTKPHKFIYISLTIPVYPKNLNLYPTKGIQIGMKWQLCADIINLYHTLSNKIRHYFF